MKMMMTKILKTKSSASLIIVAAGNSTRMGGKKKEYLPLNSGTVLSQCISSFLEAYSFKNIVIAIPAGGQKDAENAIFSDRSIKPLLKDTALILTEGGKTRQESVFKALQTVRLQRESECKTVEDDFIVLIHDGARPFVTKKIITDTIEAAEEYGASVPALQPVDTQKEKDENGFISRHLTRENLAAVQTPQGFLFSRLLDAHKKAAEDGKNYTDDTEIWGKYCGKVKIVDGDSINKKITYPSDIPQQKPDVKKESKMLRTGLGYDLHKLVEGRKLMLGGIEIPFEKGEDGHSDGDVLLHALTDALLGASGMGDIGSFFPPEDQKWKDADSKMLLKTVWNKITEKGWKLENADCVIALEKPKFIPYRQKVIESIATILEVQSDQIFVKAKTGEKMGKIGRSEAIEVWATCLLSK